MAAPMDQAQRLASGDLFEDEIFADLDLQGVDLGGKDLQRCTFRRCKLQVTRWSGSTWEDCRFEECDLGRMLPKDLAVRGARFFDSRLMGVDWTDVRPHPDLRFERCDLRYASFVRQSLRKIEIVGCAARESNFLEVDLSEARFTDTDLTDSTITGCNLTKADLSRAVGVFLDPAKNKIRGLRISTETAVLLARSLGMEVLWPL
jgi:fluoroquinolone resistance protein